MHLIRSESLRPVSWVLDCLQDYAKTTEPVFTKLGGKMWHGPTYYPLNFGADPKTRTAQTCHPFTAIYLLDQDYAIKINACCGSGLARATANSFRSV